MKYKDLLYQLAIALFCVFLSCLFFATYMIFH